MFAPVGYTPLSMLWDQFLEARLETVYRSAANHYASDQFFPTLVRGSPLDIAEHVFMGLMWKCSLHAASANGDIVKIHTRIEDGVPGLFTQIPPIKAAYDAIATELNCKDRKEIEAVASSTFEEWDYESSDIEPWRKAYPTIPDKLKDFQSIQMHRLRFHTLPICFERGRFVVVNALPPWAAYLRNNRDQEVLVEHLGGKAICVPDEKLSGWADVLSGKTPILDSEFSRESASDTHVGRPTKIPKAIEAYKELFPDGHTCSWKEAVQIVNDNLGESISVQTLRRAVNAIGTECES